jgi:hypothetical protein
MFEVAACYMSKRSAAARYKESFLLASFLNPLAAF